MLITLSRQYAAGGSRIARRVAEALGWQLVDNEFVEQVAERAGLSPEEVAQREERPPSLIERLANVTAFELPELFAHGGVRGRLDEGSLEQVTRSVVKDLAEQGNCVLVGRASAAVLARREDALHVRVVASTAFREKHAQSAFGLSPGEAAERRAEVDANRKRYHQDYYDRNVEDPTHYDFVLNSERLGWDGSAQVLIDRCRTLGWAPRD